MNRHVALILFLSFLLPTTIVAQQDANRLTYLDEFNNPYYPSLKFPKLITAQWVGEDGVKAVVTLGIDDMRGAAGYESYLRPILNRLKKIDGRAPVSIMTNAINPQEPHLQKWLKEGLSIEAHTADHPCPCLQGGNFAKAKSTYDRCVDQMFAIPNNHPVAFRFPCMDSRNTPSPRAFAEIINKKTAKGNFLQLSTSVCVLLNANDPALPRKLVVDKDGTSRFGKYVPFKSFVNKVENYPYPFIIGQLCWEFPAAVPDDWQGQNIQRPNNPKTVADMKAMIDATVIKQGTANIVFHPHNWLRSDQMVSVVDHVNKTYGKKVKFLNFKECLERIKKNMLAGQPIRSKKGFDNGVRLLDLNNDGFLDVVIGNDQLQKTRIWLPKKKRWLETSLPVMIAKLDKKGSHSLTGVRFGIVRADGFVSMIVLNENQRGAWYFNGKSWIADQQMLSGLSLAKKKICTRKNNRDQGVRLRDLNNDGRCEIIVANTKENAVFKWDTKNKTWKPLPFKLPGNATIVDIQGRDAGLRFVDVNEDGFDDVIYSNEKEFSLHLFESMSKGFSRVVRSGKRGEHNSIPMITRNGTNNGAWFAKNHMWIQNEDTNRLSDGVDRRSFVDLLGKQTPKAKSPAASLKSIRVKEGFKVELVAAEPLVKDPVCFDWGPDGKLWVVEMADYPLGLDDKGKPGGRVRYLQDTTGDGKYDKSTLFLDGLAFPNSVMAWRKGVLVCAAPDIFYAEDTNGDGKADKKDVLFTGFIPGNQQHRVNGFCRGLDNWIHVANGDSNGRIKSIKTGKIIDINGRDLRIQPDTGEIQQQTGYTQYGRQRDDWGNWFGCNNSTPIMHFALADHYIKRNVNTLPPDGRITIASTGNTRIYPISQVLSHWEGYRPPAAGAPHRFTSACSTVFYRDSLFGSEFINNIFTSEPVHNLIHRRVLEPSGTTFTSRRATGSERSAFLASSDSWFRPTSIRTGPDGGLWFADMYRLVIEHPEWIDDQTEKKLFLRAGHDKGRIYRVVPAGKKSHSQVNLLKKDTATLVAALESTNGPQRDLVQQVLIDRNDKKAIMLLEGVVKNGKIPQARLQALCTLAGLKAITPEILVIAISDQHPGVRRHAVRLADQLKSTPKSLAAALAKCVSDSDIQVRMQAAYTLGNIKEPFAGKLLGKLAIRDHKNRYMMAAILSSINQANFDAVLTTTLNHTDTASQNLEIHLVDLAVAMGSVKGLSRVLNVITESSEKQFDPKQFATLARVLAALQKYKSSLAHLRSNASGEMKQVLVRVEKLITKARNMVADEKQSLQHRQLAILLMGMDKKTRHDDLKTLAALLVPQTSGQLQLTAVKQLGRFADDEIPNLLVAGFASLGPKLRNEVLTTLLRREKWQARLLGYLEKKQIKIADISASHQQLLLSQENSKISQRAKKLFASSNNSERSKVLAKYQSVLKLKANHTRGAAIFNKKCSVCHRINDIGHVVGPDLTALTNRSPSVLLTAILDPNQAVEDKYRTYIVATEDGQQFTGMLENETGNSITLIEQESKRHQILRSDIERLRGTGKSLMPEGMEKDLKPQDLADVIAYLGNFAPPSKKFPNHKPTLVKSQDDGSLLLSAATANIYGKTLVFEQKYRNLGFWAALDDLATWSIEIPKSGNYDVLLTYAVPPDTTGNSFLVEVGTLHLQATVTSTGNWDTYKQLKLGTLNLSEGIQKVVVRPTKKPNQFLFDLKSITLVPTGKSILKSKPEKKSNPPMQSAKEKLSPIKAQADGTLVLTATAAQIEGKTIKIDPKKEFLGWWYSLNDQAAWSIEIPTAGEYEVTLTYSVHPSSAGNSFQLEIGKTNLRGKAASTGSWETFKQIKLGKIKLASGKQIVIIHPTKPLKNALLDLKSITLVPLKKLPNQKQNSTITD